MRVVLAVASATLLITGRAQAAPPVPDSPPAVSNLEMTRIFTADQVDRQADSIDWSVVSVADSKRRDAVRELLAKGALHTGEDYQHAAFVFQHGGQSSDYLLAHTLAMVATAKGRKEALWIATATLDRYLLSIEQKQIYGTQFQIPNEADKPVTQGAYDRDLISDALRAELGVHSLAEQEQRRAVMEAQRTPAKTSAKQTTKSRP